MADSSHGDDTAVLTPPELEEDNVTVTRSSSSSNAETAINLEDVASDVTDVELEDPKEPRATPLERNIEVSPGKASSSRCCSEDKPGKLPPVHLRRRDASARAGWQENPAMDQNAAGKQHERETKEKEKTGRKEAGEDCTARENQRESAGWNS